MRASRAASRGESAKARGGCQGGEGHLCLDGMVRLLFPRLIARLGQRNSVEARLSITPIEAQARRAAVRPRYRADSTVPGQARA